MSFPGTRVYLSQAVDALDATNLLGLGESEALGVAQGEAKEVGGGLAVAGAAEAVGIVAALGAAPKVDVGAAGA